MKFKSLSKQLLFTLVGLRLLGYFLPIEFVNTEVQNFIRLGLNCLVSVAFFLFIISQILDKHDPNLFTKIFTSIIMAIICVFVTTLVLSVGIMCSEVIGNSYFISINGKSKIQSRVFDCGATTEISRSDYELVSVTKFGAYIQFITKADTTKLKRNEWIRTTSEK